MRLLIVMLVFLIVSLRIKGIRMKKVRSSTIAMFFINPVWALFLGEFLIKTVFPVVENYRFSFSIMMTLIFLWMLYVLLFVSLMEISFKEKKDVQ